MRVLVSGIAAMLLAALQPAPAQDLWSYTLPEAKMVLGVDWQRARNSPTGRMIAAKMKAAGGGGTVEKGMDFLESVERILISSPGGIGGGEKQDSPVLIAIEGIIDRDKLKKMMVEGTGIERYRGIDLLIPPPTQGENMVAALVSDRVALLGDRPSVEHALEDGQGLRDAALRARATKMAAGSEFWMIATTPPVARSAKAGPAPGNLDDVRAMDLGVSLTQGLGLRMNMLFSDPGKAQGMAMFAQLLTTMAASGDKTNPELTQMARSLNVDIDGATVRMSLDIPLDTLERGLKTGFEEMGRQVAESVLGMQPPGAPPSPRVAPKPAPRREPGIIRIYGMQGGVKEIPIDPPATPR